MYPSKNNCRTVELSNPTSNTLTISPIEITWRQKTIRQLKKRYTLTPLYYI